MKKLNLSIYTKMELSKQQQSKIKGGYVVPNCGCCCPIADYGNTEHSMDGLGAEN